MCDVLGCQYEEHFKPSLRSAEHLGDNVILDPKVKDVHLVSSAGVLIMLALMVRDKRFLDDRNQARLMLKACV